MAVYALVSAKGSPGVTTTFVSLIRAWHRATGRAVLGLDLDPCGGDVAAGLLLGSPPPAAGVLSLATRRHEQATQAVVAAAVDLTQGGLLVPGVPDAARAGAIPLAWDVVVAALPELRDAATDVLVDGGRLDGSAPTPAWLPDVDHVVVVVRPSVPWVSAAHRLVNGWPARAPLGIVVIDAPSPYSAREVAVALDRPLDGVVPFDPRAAAVYSDGARPERHHRRTSYARAVDRLALALTERGQGRAVAPRPPRDMAESPAQPLRTGGRP